MRAISQDCSFYLYQVHNHIELKSKILREIQNMGSHSLVENGQKISNTDWHLGANYNRPYFEYVKPVIDEHIVALEKTLQLSEYSSLTPKNYWFQQYGKGDYHGWHTHAGVFSNVYYVDLPDGCSKTTFKFIDNIFDVPVTEGCILTFPTCYEHCSKPNPAGGKTVIAFNY